MKKWAWIPADDNASSIMCITVLIMVRDYHGIIEGLGAFLTNTRNVASSKNSRGNTRWETNPSLSNAGLKQEILALGSPRLLPHSI